jgi:hypothetical protein
VLRRGEFREGDLDAALEFGAVHVSSPSGP